MKQRKVIVWGAGGHAKVVAEILRLSGQYDVLGFIDDQNPQREGQEFFGATILGGKQAAEKMRKDGVDQAIVAIGDCAARLALAEVVVRMGYTLATAIHPRAIISPNCSVRPGTVVTAGATISPAAQVGANVILNTDCSVDHDCIVEDGVHIGPGVHLGGRVTIGRATWVGIGAVIRDGVHIGANSIIGAGAVVLKDIPDGVVAHGVPARVSRRADAK